MPKRAHRVRGRIASAFCAVGILISLWGLLSGDMSPDVGIPIALATIAAGAVGVRDLD